jgi:hypothetical protein
MRTKLVASFTALVAAVTLVASPARAEEGDKTYTVYNFSDGGTQTVCVTQHSRPFCSPEMYSLSAEYVALGLSPIDCSPPMIKYTTTTTCTKTGNVETCRTRTTY